MVGGHVCGFEDNSTIIPFNIRPKPERFDPTWFEEVTSYMLDVAVSLNAFFTHCKPAVELALAMGVPYRYGHKIHLK